jgi:hypothetical protein
VVRLSTPTVSAVEPAERARLAFGTALGILFPSAVPLRDRRIRLNRDETLPARAARAIENLLIRRAADRARDDRLLAEAVALIGAEVARARGELPARGATDAVDRFLAAPGLDGSRRAEADAMLRVALTGAAPNDPEAAARLERLRDPNSAITVSAVTDAASAIRREADLLHAATASGERRPGRHRAQVGSRHRSAGGRRVWTSQIRGTGLASGNRPSTQPPLTTDHALGVLSAMDPRALSAATSDRPTVDSASGQAILQPPNGGVPQHVRIEIGDTTLGALGQGIVRSGTANDPHVLRIPSGLSDDQVRYVMTHQFTQLTQEVAAAEAGRSRGLLGRVKSAFGSERRDRRLQADHAAFQVLLQDWHQARTETLTTGRTSGPRSLEDLQRDLEGVARTIRRHGGAEPALPWVSGPVVTPDAAALGTAAARAEARAKPAPNTVAHLRADVLTQIRTLESAAAFFDAQAETKENTAAAADEEAGTKTAEAAREEQYRDHGAAERARVLRVAATTQEHKARRHREIAMGYAGAATAARDAVTSYRNLLTEIDAGAGPARIKELAGTAQRQAEAYRRSVDRAMPAAELLMTGQPDGRPLALPADDINRILRANGIADQLPTRGPAPLAAAEYRRLLSRDGMVITVGGDPDGPLEQVAQVRLRMKPRDLREIADRDYRMAEQMSGTLGEGGTSVGTTNTHSNSQTFGLPLGQFLAMAAPGTPLHAAAQLIAPKLEYTRGRSLAETSGATGHHQSGWVDDNRGESLLYEWDGEWEIEVRNSPLESWSPVETLDAGRRQTWVSSAYTVQAPTETTSLDDEQVGHELTGEFPRHAVTSFSGLQGVADNLVRRAQQEYGDLDRVSYAHISGLILQDSHRLLREMSRPGGISRRIPAGGESEYELTWEVTPVWSEARLVGESSSEMWQEEVLVDFAGINASQMYGTSATGTASVGYPGTVDKNNPLNAATALNDVAGTGVNLSPNASVGRNVSRSGGQSVSVTTISPAVQRNEGPTQGVSVGFRVTATLRKIGDPSPKRIVESGEVRALLRVAENDLLRAGGRADKSAFLRNEDRSLRRTEDGRVLLRGDAMPSSVPQTLPPSMGRGEHQLRGVGRGQVQNLSGADEARDQALEHLAKMGLVAKPGAKATQEQIRNRQRIEQQISAPRMEAGIDQACQGGLIVMLEERGPLGTPRWRPFRLTATQEYDPQTFDFVAEGLGVTASEKVVRLGISSSATSRTSARSKSVPLSAGVGGSHTPGEGVAGGTGRAGVKGTRNARGRNWSWTSGRRVNRVTLNESTEPLDRFRQQVRIRFAEITDKGDAPPIADVTGSMEVSYDSSLTRTPAPQFEAAPKPPHRAAVQQSIPVAVDAGNLADTICDAVPALRADSTALPALHQALSPTSLVANYEWMNGEYRLPFTVVRAPGNPVHALTDGTILPDEYQVVIRGEAVSLTHLAMTQENTVDINFTMTDVGTTSGTSHSGGVSVSGGGGHVGADGTEHSGGLSYGRTGGRSQSTTTSETAGEERLLINPGTHHEFLERYKMTADVVHDGKVVRSIPLPDAMAQKAMAERRALELYATGKLDLPLWVASDAAERLLTDKLRVSHRVAAGFVSRYQREKAGVTTGLAAEHTPDRLAAKLRERAKVPASHAESAEDRLRTTVRRIAEQAAQRRQVHTSDVYKASLGPSQIESLTLQTSESRHAGEFTDEPIDLRAPVTAQIDEVAPELRGKSLLLQNALNVDLSPGSFHGHLENMLGPGGASFPIEVPLQGQERPDLLFVRVVARFEGDLTIEDVPLTADGTPDVPEQEAGSLLQNYDYEALERSAGRTVVHSGGIDGKPGLLGLNGSAGLSTDQTRTDQGTEGVQNTTIDRGGHFNDVLAHRTVVFTTQVVRVRQGGAAALTGTRMKLTNVDPAEITSVSEPREVRADLRQWIPRDEVLDGPPPAHREEPGTAVEHRPIELPEGSFAVRAALDNGKNEGKDNENAQNPLVESLAEKLGRTGLLGERGVTEYRGMLAENLQPTALKAKAGRLLNEGLDLQPMVRPGNGNTVVKVKVTAARLGFELHGPEVEGQEGHVWRRQGTHKNSTSSNRLLPATATGSLDGGVVTGGASIGEQVKEQSSDGNGTRLEGSRFIEGQLVTVRIPVVYSATVETATDKGRGEPAERTSTQLPELARGEFYVRMLRHRYLAILERMENGATLDAALAEERLQAEPTDFGPPDIVASEVVRTESGEVHRPYRPLVDALAKAKLEGKSLVVLVRGADGVDRTYEATKEGRLSGSGDGGFGAAFSTLHPTVALMAEGRVDLRELYNTAEPGGSFSAKVADALERAGVPRDMLKGLDYATTQRAVAPATGQGTRAAGASGRHISTTASGPSLSGP